MKRKWKVGCLLTIGLIFSPISVTAQQTAQQQVSALDGTWRVTYYTEPNRTPTGPWCIAFTTVANSVLNQPLSGTWQATNLPSGSNWGGNWIQIGDRVQWWGSYSPIPNYATSHQGTLITSLTQGATNGSMTGQHQHYQAGVGGGGLTSIQPNVGNWLAQQVTTCP